MADASSSEEDHQGTLVKRAISTALVPVHVATSRPAIKAYLSTILFLTTSFILLSLSTSAYLFFYYNYVPQINLSRVIHLQHGAGQYPHATVPLETSSLISQQPYDISIELHIPRTPSNLAAGNFMLDLSLLTDLASSVPSKLSNHLPNGSSILPYKTLATSRRPAILPYSSPLFSLASKLVSLPWCLLRFRDLDSHHLLIPMFEHFSFARGSASNVPSAIRLELQSDHILQIYSSTVTFKAKFEGLRYLIYNYRISSFLIFSTLFYTVTVLSMATAWLTISALIPTSEKDTAKRGSSENIKSEPSQEDEKPRLSNGHIKTESADQKMKKSTLDSDSESDHGLSLSNISDSATTFPGIGRQMPLHMPVRNTSGSQDSTTAVGSGSGSGMGRSSHVSLRNTGASEEHILPDTLIEPLPGQAYIKKEDVADDEDEDDLEEEADRGRRRDFDSGIGTSMESENAAAGLIRRRSSQQNSQRERNG